MKYFNSEDLLEKAIRQFGQALLKIMGLLERSMLSEALLTIESYYDELFIQDFLKDKIDIAANPFIYKKLLFNADLMYHQILILQKKGMPVEDIKNRFLAVSKKLLANNRNFEYALQMKIKEIENRITI